MLSTEQSFFLNILSDHLNGRSTATINDLDTALLLSVSQSQQCTGIVYYQTKIEQLRVPFAANSYTAVQRTQVLKDINKLFGENNIRYLIFKGSEVAQFYPVPQLRTMGDSDIMVHPEDRQRAHELLVANGFVNECLGPNEWIYHKGKIEIELHHRLMNDELVSLPSHNEFMETAWENAYSDDGVQFHLDWTYHLTFLFLHLRKHFMNSGVGFRQFMDIAVVSTRCEIDWEKFGQNIEKLAITEFVQNCYAFIKMWFDVEAHVKVKPLDAKFYENSTDKIFDNGIFGFDDKGNKDNYTVIQLRNKNRTHGKIGLFFGSYFPKYSEMAEIPKYGFIKNKPYLLPIAWIYRFFTAISNGAVKKNVVRVNGKMLISQETVDKRENYLREWGL